MKHLAIYRPDTERWSHYTQATLPRQFDGYVWFDQTHAVDPLPTEQREGAGDLAIRIVSPLRALHRRKLAGYRRVLQRHVSR